MTIFNHFTRYATVLTGALLLCASLAVHADDVDDANSLFKQGERSEALDKINGYLASKPKDARARFLKGLILTEQGKTADAIKIFSALTDDYPDLPEPYNNLAVLYAGQGQYDKAKILLEKAINTHPSYATAHENLGDIYAHACLLISALVFGYGYLDAVHFRRERLRIAREVGIQAKKGKGDEQGAQQEPAYDTHHAVTDCH